MTTIHDPRVVHVRKAGTVADRRRISSLRAPLVAETLCGARPTEFDMSERDARRALTDATWAARMCPKCRAALPR